MIYLIYEASKGRKDLVFVASSKDLAFSNALFFSECCPSFTYRVFEVEENVFTFYVDKLTPLRVYRKGLPF